MPPIDRTTPPSPTQQKAGVLWNKVRDHVVSDDNFAETPRPVQDEDGGEKNLGPSTRPTVVYLYSTRTATCASTGISIQMVSLIWVSIFVPLRIGLTGRPSACGSLLTYVIDLYFIFDFVLGFFTLHLHEDTRVDDDASGDYFELAAITLWTRNASLIVWGMVRDRFFALCPHRIFHARLEQVH